MGAQLSRRRKISQSKKAAAKKLDQTQSNSSFTSKSKGTELFGRLYHDVESSVYFYPMDETEQDRLHGQHFALKALFGGDILEPVRGSIDLDDNCHVLDVGCGPGSWLLDLATSYPNSKFVGIDVVDMFPSTIRPPNTEFYVRNILDGLNMFSDNSFDFVQMRLFASVLKVDQWATTLTELKRVCRPGGTIQLLEVDYKVRGNSTVNQYTTKLVEVMAKRGLDGEMAKKLAPALTQAGFVNVQTDHRSVAGGWDGALSNEIWLDIKNAMVAATPLISPAYGLDNASYLTYLDDVFEHVKESRAYINWWGCCAQKPL